MTKTKDQRPKTDIFICRSPQDTFDLGEKISESLAGGEMILLKGGLGAGKTLLTKGILYALDYDVDEVTSPSFTLVNLYRTAKFDVYHIDLWRIDEKFNAASAVGLDEILEDETAVTIIEWSERLRKFQFPEKTLEIEIKGDGDLAREISIKSLTSNENRIS
ncbi:MAG: tRNA (adenosine(37)-N6)-threonylcarbamoyltransferase complex ATPase subunit type 1 TsaE [Pyrinomonadaceae bacterium]|nr:tRNA (adenosine(37)-N6)-threonylcarbamoyltransferase complex ATPase subunit type 1 TsaE [Pyrinomonadaceae bacterium]